MKKFPSAKLFPTSLAATFMCMPSSSDAPSSIYTVPKTGRWTHLLAFWLFCQPLELHNSLFTNPTEDPIEGPSSQHIGLHLEVLPHSHLTSLAFAIGLHKVLPATLFICFKTSSLAQFKCFYDKYTSSTLHWVLVALHMPFSNKSLPAHLLLY